MSSRRRPHSSPRRSPVTTISRHAYMYQHSLSLLWSRIVSCPKRVFSSSGCNIFRVFDGAFGTLRFRRGCISIPASSQYATNPVIAARIFCNVLWLRPASYAVKIQSFQSWVVIAETFFSPSFGSSQVLPLLLSWSTHPDPHSRRFAAKKFAHAVSNLASFTVPFSNHSSALRSASSLPFLPGLLLVNCFLSPSRCTLMLHLPDFSSHAASFVLSFFISCTSDLTISQVNHTCNT